VSAEPRARFAPERHRFVLQRLAAAGRVEAAQLADELGVSNESIRKDLVWLEDRGMLRRVHGGAIPVAELAFEPHVQERISFADEKDAIVRAALRHIPAGASLLLDAGSTIARLASALPPGGDHVVCTNSLPIATLLAGRPPITVRCLGGTIRRPSLAGVGQVPLDALAAVNVDIAFLGTNGISRTRGLTTPDEQEALVKNRMVHTARRRILLADHSKFGRESLCRHARLADIDLLITDSGVSQGDLDAVSEHGVEVEVA
jgi:DeoR family fructose operon transcriptional repressor